VKRDLDLLRKIIFAVEDRCPEAAPGAIEIEGYSATEIGYHSYLLADSGLAKGVDVTTTSDALPQWQILHLTSEGHDFADAARNDSTWKAATKTVRDKTGGVTLEVMKQVLISVVKNTLGL
jgi:hypothetical protein